VASRVNLTAARDAVAERMKARVHVKAGRTMWDSRSWHNLRAPRTIYQLPVRSSQDIHVNGRCQGQPTSPVPPGGVVQGNLIPCYVPLLSDVLLFLSA
jgi:hypothetical protein